MHPTMPDELVGELYVVETRRAKFVAVSALTPDLLDTTAELDSFEGEVEDSPLDSLMQSYGQFDWGIDGHGEARSSTFEPPISAPDAFNFKPRLAAETRFHQYQTHYNDRRGGRVPPARSGSRTIHASRPRRRRGPVRERSASRPRRRRELVRRGSLGRSTRRGRPVRRGASGASLTLSFSLRAKYSLACVLDGTCPVNFADQLIDPGLDKPAVDPIVDWATSTSNFHPEEPLPWTVRPESSWGARGGGRRLEEEAPAAPAATAGWNVVSPDSAEAGDPFSHVRRRT